MALIPSLVQSNESNQPNKGTKTKAKQRYLKAKKERKKHNSKRSQTHPSGGNIVAELKDPHESDTEDGGDDPLPQVQPVEGKKRPQKKRKLDTPASDVELEALDSVPKEEKNRSGSPIREDPPPENDILYSQEESLPFLPSFPLPSQPAPPSASVLYLQGLDQAIIEAEVIDASRTMPLSPNEPLDKSQLGLKTRQRLSQLGILELFAVQTALLPFLLPTANVSHSLYLPYDPPRDVCVSAPTGSGKTLAYVLPIIEVLSTRIVTRLRALVVLPTRDLVSQVKETFDAVCKGRGLKIGTATGQHSFAQEQNQIVGDVTTRLNGGSSKVDILICTPGRLIDHLVGTPNFTLQHLRFLVIDEADRLVTQTFQDWLAQVLNATQPRSQFESPPVSGAAPVPRHDAVAPSWLPTLSSASHDIGVSTRRTDLDEKKESSCQKLLFSATLTSDPSKIAALNLRNPKYFVVGGGDRSSDGTNGIAGEAFAFPASLKEHMLVCESVQKPLMLLYLIHAHSVSNALVFTKSAESTARLVKLVEFFEKSYTSTPTTETGTNSEENIRKPIVAQAYSSDLSNTERKSILETFRNGDIQLLVCSDLISRGIDISHVSHVVSYDSPVDIRKYVHRVGRTARAGREGDAWSLVEEQEARYFKKMLSGANHLEHVTKMRVSSKSLEPFTPHYEMALGQLRDVYARHSVS